MSKVHNNASGIIIKDRKVLMVRSSDMGVFIAPGGAIEPGETAAQAVCRELEEECTIRVSENDLEPYGEYKADAAGRPGDKIVMQAFLVNNYKGTFKPSSEVEEHLWLDSSTMNGYPTGSIFKKQIIPKLKTQGLID